MKRSYETGSVQRLAVTVLPTRWGVFRMLGFERNGRRQRHPETAVVLILGDPGATRRTWRRWFGFTPSVSRVMCFDLCAAIVVSNWNSR